MLFNIDVLINNSVFLIFAVNGIFAAASIGCSSWSCCGCGAGDIAPGGAGSFMCCRSCT